MPCRVLSNQEAGFRAFLDTKRGTITRVGLPPAGRLKRRRQRGQSPRFSESGGTVTTPTKRRTIRRTPCSLGNTEKAESLRHGFSNNLFHVSVSADAVPSFCSKRPVFGPFFDTEHAKATRKHQCSVHVRVFRHGLMEAR